MSQDPILIVGAGVFGLTLAQELAANRGYTNITVLDRHPPPVPDGSSTDISRVIRTEYADPFYARLAREAMDGWTSPPGYPAYYYQSGFVMLSDDEKSAYFAGAGEQSSQAGGGFEMFAGHESEEALRKRYPGISADLKGRAAAHNPGGGWANAAGAMRFLAESCERAGVKIITGEEGIVTEILQDGEDKRVTGVKTSSGDVYSASRVVLATGAWTNGLLEGFEHAMSGSGQPVGFIQLTKEEAKSLDPSPVMIDLDTGVFVFPPTPVLHVLKVARHGFGYSTEVPALASSDGQERLVSAPKTFSNNASSAYIPQGASDDLREGLRRLVPQFADRPWAKTRLCWYTDTPTSDFIVDDHPDISGLFVATGGAGQ